jgi:hypothetical protein
MGLSTAVNAAARATERNPTDAQKESGNYAKGKVRLHGLEIAIENPKGGKRAGTDKGGKAWSVTMPAHYGYVKGTEGKDGDHVDVYIGPKPDSDKVWVVDQIDAGSKRFDEHKVMMGYASKADAVSDYKRAFSDGKGSDRIGSVTELSVGAFKDWLRNGDTMKPMAKANTGLSRATGGRVGYSDGGAPEQSATFQIRQNANGTVSVVNVRTGQVMSTHTSPSSARNAAGSWNSSGRNHGGAVGYSGGGSPFGERMGLSTEMLPYEAMESDGPDVLAREPAPRRGPNGFDGPAVTPGWREALGAMLNETADNPHIPAMGMGIANIVGGARSLMDDDPSLLHKAAGLSQMITGGLTPASMIRPAAKVLDPLWNTWPRYAATYGALGAPRAAEAVMDAMDERTERGYDGGGAVPLSDSGPLPSQDWPETYDPQGPRDALGSIGSGIASGLSSLRDPAWEERVLAATRDREALDAFAGREAENLVTGAGTAGLSGLGALLKKAAPAALGAGLGAFGLSSSAGSAEPGGSDLEATKKRIQALEDEASGFKKEMDEWQERRKAMMPKNRAPSDAIDPRTEKRKDEGYFQADENYNKAKQSYDLLKGKEGTISKLQATLDPEYQRNQREAQQRHAQLLEQQEQFRPFKEKYPKAYANWYYIPIAVGAGLASTTALGQKGVQWLKNRPWHKMVDEAQQGWKDADLSIVPTMKALAEKNKTFDKGVAAAEESAKALDTPGWQLWKGDAYKGDRFWKPALPTTIGGLGALEAGQIPFQHDIKILGWDKAKEHISPEDLKMMFGSAAISAGTASTLGKVLKYGVPDSIAPIERSKGLAGLGTTAPALRKSMNDAGLTPLPPVPSPRGGRGKGDISTADIRKLLQPEGQAGEAPLPTRPFGGSPRSAESTPGTSEAPVAGKRKTSPVQQEVQKEVAKKKVAKKLDQMDDAASKAARRAAEKKWGNLPEEANGGRIMHDKHHSHFQPRKTGRFAGGPVYPQHGGDADDSQGILGVMPSAMEYADGGPTSLGSRSIISKPAKNIASKYEVHAGNIKVPDYLVPRFTGSKPANDRKDGGATGKGGGYPYYPPDYSGKGDPATNDLVFAERKKRDIGGRTVEEIEAPQPDYTYGKPRWPNLDPRAYFDRPTLSRYANEDGLSRAKEAAIAALPAMALSAGLRDRTMSSVKEADAMRAYERALFGEGRHKPYDLGIRGGQSDPKGSLRGGRSYKDSARDLFEKRGVGNAEYNSATQPYRPEAGPRPANDYLPQGWSIAKQHGGAVAGYDHGGVVSGPIVGDHGGRSDTRPVSVESGSFVIPADVVAYLGEGNTLRGFKVLESQFGATEPTQAAATGGAVPIKISDGEYSLSPAQVARAGGGSVDQGHALLDKMVLALRQKHIAQLKSLPAPAKS